MTVRIECVDIDCRDPQQLARFWMQALDYEVASEEPSEIAIRAKDGSGWELLFLQVPDDKVVKNRWHLDLRPDDQAAEVVRLSPGLRRHVLAPAGRRRRRHRGRVARGRAAGALGGGRGGRGYPGELAGRLAQLARAAGLQPAGRGFESLSAHTRDMALLL